MRIVSWSIHLDLDNDGYLQFPADATDKEIEDAVREVAFNGLDWGYSEVDNQCLACTKMDTCIKQSPQVLACEDFKIVG